MPESLLDKALKQQIREYAAERGAWLTDEQVNQALQGVKFWFLETVNDSISTALDEVGVKTNALQNG